jgi:serine/threonine-protein kinase
MRAEARAAASDPAVGGQFVLEHRVHAGVHAEVWRAQDSTGAPVAVKLARPAPEARARLRAERAWLEGFRHAAILYPVAWIDDSRHMALVAEYIDGGDLLSLAGAGSRHWTKPMAEVAEALAYLHARSIVHRDVKARNVLLDSAGRARLIDFGSAAEMGAPRTLGSTTAAHRYSDSGTISAADDVYAFAVLLYELMAGRLPFGAAPERSKRDAEPPLLAPLRRRPMLAALERLVLETLAAPAKRSIHEFRDVIKSAIGEELSRS